MSYLANLITKLFVSKSKLYDILNIFDWVRIRRASKPIPCCDIILGFPTHVFQPLFKMCSILYWFFQRDRTYFQLFETRQ